MPRIIAVLAVVALACGGCSRHRDPSPEFSRASETFNKLYAQRLDDAYLDPKMREVEALLQRVPTDSLDAQAATELLNRIQEGRVRMQKAQDEAQAAGAAARTPSTVSNAPLAAPGELTATAAVALPPRDAGPAESMQPTAGMPTTEFNRRFADCFQIAGPVNIQGGGAKDSYELVDSSRCRAAHPGFADAIVVADGQAVFGVVPKSALIRPPPPPEDAGAPEAAAAASPDAG
ncbi:MAG: hypothetical protein ACLQIH_06200 [Myxococcaceae bacterium]